ncbi:16S rRNA (cytosine(967)-C(5))-methyltransferase RsmB [Siminovitchia fortis]|uniref:16S rRNA (cytosine(967)-C(5))-methyltransferase n=1 Tax=Siminovitchia fortis TaxID=254758 RepID=A0A443J128_9BACI|nr:16S rRNA (cytosine(967)-C(5))-methyltransferase RsmB [Siminovitchia fortis]RWR14082.1 16S rRNA (cytosine(967)-C(5))-methyltransferase RsmB [Siminovitchia fortis]WHY83348.1 16S rRNA (cytosine(967)-C(5))-methyltransferase RsmB [Siminovitchia fortis]
MNKHKKNVREAALDIIEAVERNRSYSNLLLNETIKKHQFTGADAALLTEISYGTIQRKMTLDYYLTPFVKKKVEHWVRLLLRLSVYQMVYLDKIPDRAVIHEAVEIAKRRGHKGIAGLVNGVLRSVQRKGIPSLDEIKDPTVRLSIETSHPEWLVKRWIDQYGFDQAKNMCEENLLAPVQTARVNETLTNREHVIEQLKEEGISAVPSPLLPFGIQAVEGNLARSKAYKEGLFTIQDESSMLVAYALELEPGQRVLDACAAPGGKTTHIAEMLDNTGKVIALDLHPHKVKLIMDQVKRLHLKNVEAKAMDSRKTEDVFEMESFDRVLVDAPCSGLGVLRRKPDIKYSKAEEDIYALKSVQMDILNETSKLVKKGGLLVFSTCTVDKEENEETAAHFLEHHPEFEPNRLRMPEALPMKDNEYSLQIFPQDFGGDGFFISSFRKKGS